MQVQTVVGVINSGEMGFTLPHEHILIDLTSTAEIPKDSSFQWLIDAPVSIDILGLLRYHGGICKDNLLLSDVELACLELELFKKSGGRTVVDLTNRGLSPRPADILSISKRTGLNIILGCGYYTAQTHPKDMSTMTQDQIAEEIIRDLSIGVNGSSVKAGIIGEIGTSHPIRDNERKVLKAAAHAHKVTGASINVHVAWRGNHAPEVIRILEQEGVDGSRVIISHMDDVREPVFENHKSVLERGAFVEFDSFGQEEYHLEINYERPRDTDRVRELMRLIDAGYLDNLLMSQDIGWKTGLRRYGGCGYDHIALVIIPMLRGLGLNNDEIQSLTVLNPARALAH